MSSSSNPPTADGFGAGTPEPSPQSQSFSRSYGSILPTSLIYIILSTRGFSPWRPAAVMSTTERENYSFRWIFKDHHKCTEHSKKSYALPAIRPFLLVNRFQGTNKSCQKEKITLLGTCADVSNFNCVTAENPHLSNGILTIFPFDRRPKKLGTLIKRNFPIS